MKMEERIEAAAKAVFGSFYGGSSGLDEQAAAIAKAHAELAIEAAFPELFTDPPEAWIAPFEATAGMRKAMHDAFFGELFEGVNEPRSVSPSAAAWIALRDAHLSDPPQSEE